MEDLEKKLRNYKTALAEANTKIANLEGSRDSLLGQLDKEFGLSTVEDAEKELQSVVKDKERVGVQIQSLIRKIEDSYKFE
jgi:chromosome segregation ATPase